MTTRIDADGTPVEVITLSADLADGNYAGGTATFDNTGAADKWPFGRATIVIPDGFTAGAWDAGPYIGLYMVKQDIDGTNDELAPSTTDGRGAHFLGSFAIDDHATIATPQYKQIIIDLLDVGKANFYLQNMTGRTIDYVATDITVSIEGVSRADS